jgi:ribosomal protein S18 acetylase RimI-like enzyme
VVLAGETDGRARRTLCVRLTKARRPVTVSHIAHIPDAWRSERLDRLAEPQELFVEGEVAKGTAFVLGCEGDHARPLGYAVVDREGCLLEVGLEERTTTLAPEVLTALRTAAGVRAILAQSFDPLLMSAGLRFGGSPETRGILYRRVRDTELASRGDVLAAPAGAEDVDAVAALGADFFDDAAEVEAYRALGGLMVYRDARGELLGAGVMKRAIPARTAVDLGMVVAPAYRRRGLGVHIVRHLKRHCVEQGLRPVCGCDVANVASQRTLERAGFASVHTLLRFALPAQGQACT